MAKANVVLLCRTCSGEVGKGQDRCSICGAAQNGAKNSPFATPDYISYQYRTMVEALQSGVKGDAKKEEVEEKLKSEMRKWYKESVPEDKLASLEEAFHMMKDVMHSTVNIETMKKITYLGKKIGELAVSIETYASKGGNFNAPTETGRSASIEDLDQT